MTTRAATRCWGLALTVGLLSPLGCGRKPPATPKPAPAPRQAAVARPSPPALPVYEYAWRADLGSSGSIDLAVGGALVFAIGGDDGLAAFTSSGGRKVWTSKNVNRSTRLIASGTLLFLVTPGHPDDSGRPLPGRMDVLNQADGRLLWSVGTLTDPILDPVIGDRVAVLATGNEVRAFSPHDGFVTWRTPLGAAPVALAIDGDRVFVALADRALVAVDLTTHDAWRTTLESGAKSLVAANRRVFVSGDDGALYAYHADRGAAAIWKINRVEGVGRPVVDDRLIYVAEFDNTARAYDAGNGTERWRVRLSSRPRPGIQAPGGQVFVPLLTAVMATCLSKSGAPAGQIPVLAPAGEPAPIDQRLEASGVSSDGRLLFRVTRPSAYTAWTLSAVKRK